MRFLEIINQKRFTFISIFLFLYVVLNLIEGERGIISYYEKQNRIEQLFKEKESLVFQLDLIEKKNTCHTAVFVWQKSKFTDW